MARRNNGRRPRGRGPKRNLFWARFTSLTTHSETNNIFQANLTNFFEQQYGASLFGFTVYRIVGHYTHYALDQVDTTTTYNFSLGIRVDEPSEAGIPTDAQQASLLPINDPHADWMYARNNLGITPAIAQTEPDQQAFRHRVELDLRAKRKLSELGQKLYVIGGLNEYPGTDVYSWLDLNVLMAQP